MQCTGDEYNILECNHRTDLHNSGCANHGMDNAIQCRIGGKGNHHFEYYCSVEAAVIHVYTLRCIACTVDDKIKFFFQVLQRSQLIVDFL